MSKSRVNKTKVLIGGALKRKNPSKASTIFEKLKILSSDTLDYGCGYGFDADYNKWAKYDPYYFDEYPIKQFQNIVCINVLNVVSSKIRNNNKYSRIIKSRWNSIFNLSKKCTNQRKVF